MVFNVREVWRFHLFEPPRAAQPKGSKPNVFTGRLFFSDKCWIGSEFRVTVGEIVTNGTKAHTTRAPMYTTNQVGGGVALSMMRTRVILKSRYTGVHST